VPSDTESVFALGAGDRLVGRTRYCVEPADAVAALPEVGGTKDPDVDAILALAPDLVLANQEENSRPSLERLAQRGVNVFVSFPRRVADAVRHLARLARILGLEGEPAASSLVRRGYQIMATPARPEDARVPAFVPIWLDPLMTAHGDTYLSDLLAVAGARNVFADRRRRYPLAADLGERPATPEAALGDRDTRYPRVTVAEVEARAPAIVLLPDEPYAFSEADADRFRAHATPAAARGAIARCDGKDLTWPGARTVEAVPRVRELVRRLAAAG
jgi:ABC-type hemin transport system substrate-binding protein